MRCEKSAEWDDYDLITECDRCGGERPCIKRSDPFIAQVYIEETEKTYWCEECFSAWVADV